MNESRTEMQAREMGAAARYAYEQHVRHQVIEFMGLAPRRNITIRRAERRRGRNEICLCGRKVKRCVCEESQ